MKAATEILRKEHEAILGMLELTESAAARLDRGQILPTGTLAGLLEFFQLFADRCHHGKEEDLLFPLLEKKGLPREGGPLGVMLHEHEQGRALIREMKAADAALEAGEAEAGRRWARAARGYAQLLRDHIFKENNILFVMAERLLSAEEQSELAAGFERAEIEKMGAGTHERLHASMDQLRQSVSAEPA